MRTLRATVLAAAMLTAGAASAQTTIGTEGPTRGWYVGMGFGWNNIGGRPILINGTRVQAKFKDGFAVAGAGGYKWSESVRTELEISYRENKVKNFNTSSTPWTGTQRDTSAMGNVVFDIPTGGRWTPYVGAGIGIAWMNWDQFKGLGPTVYDGTSSKFAWQGIAGISVNVAPRLQLALDYRYKGSNHHAYLGSAAGTRITNYDARQHTVMLGFRYAFGGPAPAQASPPPPPPPPPAPPPPRAAATPPPPPPAEQKFLVFFDFDRSNLRADSQRIVQQAVDYAKTNGKVRLTTTGHADTSGTDAYNIALSERRAQTVQKELNRLGIPDGQIIVRFRGEAEPLVQTGDGVREPQNRRVEIVIE